MAGRRGLVMGVANDHSIAWGIAQALHRQGAELAFSYQGDALGRRVRPLAESLGAKLVLPCDVEDLTSVDGMFERLRAEWGEIDFVAHCIAYSAKAELKGRYADTTRENFQRTMLISAFSFTEIANRAAALMRPGGSLLTLTFGGATRVVPNYNVMGVAKAALEAGVRYLAADYGPQIDPRHAVHRERWSRTHPPEWAHDALRLPGPSALQAGSVPQSADAIHSCCLDQYSVPIS